MLIIANYEEYYYSHLHVYIYRLTKLILSNLSVVKMSLDAPLGWSGQEKVNQRCSLIR